MHNSTRNTPTSHRTCTLRHTHTHRACSGLQEEWQVLSYLVSSARMATDQTSPGLGFIPSSRPALCLPLWASVQPQRLSEAIDGRMTGADSLSSFIWRSNWNAGHNGPIADAIWFVVFELSCNVKGSLRNGLSRAWSGCNPNEGVFKQACMSGRVSQLSKGLWQLAPQCTCRWKEDEGKRGAPLYFVIFHCPILHSVSHPPFGPEINNWNSCHCGARPLKPPLTHI